jgi:hypothetical protein
MTDDITTILARIKETLPKATPGPIEEWKFFDGAILIMWRDEENRRYTNWIVPPTILRGTTASYLASVSPAAMSVLLAHVEARDWVIDNTIDTLCAENLRMREALAEIGREQLAAARERAPGSRPSAELPVNRENVTLTDGSPVTPDHRELKPNGQQKGYVVLSEEERRKGFVRPVRRSYVHLTCGAVTTMGEALAETYARDPYFYSGTFCSECRAHFPVGDDGEFDWQGTTEKVGT